MPLSSPSDAVAFNIASWADTTIQITGFTGDYGDQRYGTWTLNTGDQVQVQVWNPQTGDGPASYTTTVGQSSTTPPPTTTCGGIPGPCYCITGPSGSCGPSTGTTGTGTTTAPSTPTGLTVKATGTSAIKLKWTDSGATSLAIQLVGGSARTTAATTYNWTGLQVVEEP